MRRYDDLGLFMSALDEGLAVRATDIARGSEMVGPLLYTPPAADLRQLKALDPFSPEYLAWHMRLFEVFAGGAHDLSNEGHDYPGEGGGPPRFPFPFQLGPTQAGYWTVIYGHLLQRLDLPADARVLEVGYGPGGLTELLVRAGLQVTAVDPRPGNAAYVRSRVEPLGHPVIALTGKIEDVPLAPPYDAVIFFESFHHIPKFHEALERLVPTLAPGGKLVFAAEPVVDDDDPIVPYPWGLRLDGGSLGAARAVGWLEIGFQRSFFEQMLTNLGLQWSFVSHLFGYHHSMIYIAQRTP